MPRRCRLLFMMRAISPLQIRRFTPPLHAADDAADCFLFTPPLCASADLATFSLARPHSAIDFYYDDDTPLRALLMPPC